MYDLIIKNGTVLIKQPDASYSSEITDIAINNGKITKIETKILEPAHKTIDAHRLTVLPGLIDSQVHFREPGLTHKEDLESGTKGAVLGGITAIFDMPNTKPNTDSKEALALKVASMTDRAWCNYAFYMGATVENASIIGELADTPGCCGVKIFMGSSTGNLLVSEDEHIETIFKSTDRTIALHCEDEERLIERKQIAIDGAHPKYHPVWRDELTALNATKRVLEICKKTGRKAHVLHVTTQQEMHLLKESKHLVSVECTPQHLTLSAPDCYERLGTLAQMNPPVRGIEHQNALWEAINNGTVDVIGSDHAPHTLEEKGKTYPQSPSGFTGVQTTVPLMLNHVNNGKLTLEKMTDLLSYNQAQLFHIQNKGQIKVGFDADFTIVDLNKEVKITNEWIASKSGWTPYDKMSVKGWPTHTIIRGQVVMENDQLHQKGLGTPLIFSK